MKTRKKLIAILLIILNLMMLFSNTCQAVTLDSANLYSKGDCGDLLKYNGALLYSTFVVYKHNGVEYPAYCLQRELDGVREHGPYTVTINNILSNVAVWRTIINGYPYKTPSQLGCATKEEAYTATKQAIYCTIYGNNINNYQAVGTAGNRTLSALKKILNDAKNSKENIISTDLKITPQTQNWQIDSINSKYISKSFKVSSDITLNKYTVKLQGNIPEEARITDINNNSKSEFSGGETFKILLPITNLRNNGEFYVNVTSNINSKPVFYGKSPSSNLQDYAITAASYEDISGNLKLNYIKNDTNMIIKKQEENTKKPLEGVKFDLLDNNRNVVYKELITNQEGKINLDNMLPGKYFLQETSTKDGYVLYDKLIECNLDWNETLSIVVNNSKEQVTQITNKEENINVVQTKEELIISNQVENKDEVNIQTSTQISNNIKNENGVNIQINNENNNSNTSEQTTNTNINNENSNSNTNEQTTNTNINNENSNSNTNEQITNTNINNENSNINTNEQITNTNINNENSNSNTNEQTTNTNINNENSNINTNEQTTNTNIDNENSNININEQTNDTNISNNNTNSLLQLSGMKLPKTGM